MVARSSATDRPDGCCCADAGWAADTGTAGVPAGSAAWPATEASVAPRSAGAAEVQSGRGSTGRPRVGAGGGSTDTVVTVRSSPNCGRLAVPADPARLRLPMALRPDRSSAMSSSLKGRPGKATS
eukprot:3051315-Alexandrium_andersonii.AAC.1